MFTASFQAEAELELRRRKTKRQESGELDNYSTFKTEYRNDPAGFVSECIKWQPDERQASNYQRRILEAIPTERRVSVRGPHGLGKTALAAWVILWFALTRDGEDWKIPTTASAWRQLTKFLWPEIRKWARRLDWDKIGRSPFNDRLELLSLSIKLDTGEAFALASDNSDLIEGAHADNILYVFDEAKAIPNATWESAEGAMATGDAYWLAISTPSEPQGTFYDIHRRSPGYSDWYAVHVTLQDAIDAGRISKAWADARRKQWGEDSAAFKNRVLGEFATSQDDGVISLALVEAANERWYELQESGAWEPFTCVGVDVGRGGDKSVFALRFGDAIKELRHDSNKDTMVVAGKTLGILRKYAGQAIIDVIGIGAGVYDYLRNLDLNVVAFNASEGTDKTDKSEELKFKNKRSYAWWNMRELLEDEKIALPPDDMLTGDLTAPRWRVMAGGRIQVEAKETIKERIGRSTDDGDAVIMAFYEGEPQGVFFA